MPTSSALPPGVNAYDPTGAATRAKTSLGTSAAETQDYFMKMLLAQIQNQDPMNAQDPAQMTSQLTQLNTASGIERLNTSINAMLAQAQAQSFVNSAALIGDNVLAPGSVLALGDAGVADFGFRLDADSTQTRVRITAADGRVVDELSLGALAKGTHSFLWDGVGEDGQRAPAGSYRLSLTAADGKGASVGGAVLTQGVVAGVRRSDTGVQLLKIGRAHV